MVTRDIRACFGKATASRGSSSKQQQQQQQQAVALTSSSPRRRSLDSQCWYEQGKLPQELAIDFDALWGMHPTEHEIFKIMGKEIQVPRWQQVYLKPYNFSNTNHVAVMELPPVVQVLFDWANSTEHGPFNSAIVVWYQNGQHYIGPHR
jgi:hypothetical protein